MGSHYGKRIQMRRRHPARKEAGGRRMTERDNGLFSFVHLNTGSSFFNKHILSTSCVADHVPGTGETAMNESQSLPSNSGGAEGGKPILGPPLCQA